MPLGAGKVNARRPGRKIVSGKGNVEIPMRASSNASKSPSKSQPLLRQGKCPSPCSSEASYGTWSTCSDAMINLKHSLNHLDKTGNSRRQQFDEPPKKTNFRSTLVKEEISHLSGPTLTPDVTKLVPSLGSLKGKGETSENAYRRVGKKERCGNSGSLDNIPLMFLSSNSSQNDFVRDPQNRTPPPDFIESDSLTSGVQTISSQPDLSTMLSGAVKNSALFKQRRDFVPTAVLPLNQLRAKSKSLCDLSKVRDKTRRYLDRRKLIEMDLNDNECCSHTEVGPSSMMTLAMELLVSRENKAATLFSEAKKKTDGTETSHNSILPSLWVVPKAPPNSAGKTASQLRPAMKLYNSNSDKTPNIDSDKRPCQLNNVSQLWNPKQEHCSSVARNKSSDKKRPSLESIAPRVFRRQKSESSHPKTRCIALSEQTVDHHNDFSHCVVERIDQDDVERDLRTLTVADLVGSPDTVYTDTESELYVGHAENIKMQQATVGKESAVATPDCFASDPNIRKSVAHTGLRCNFEERERDIEDSAYTFTPENTYPLSAYETNTATKLDRGRRLSSASTSSSLTTVSSLSFSPHSMSPADISERESRKQYPPYTQDSNEEDSTSFNINASALEKPSKKVGDIEEEEKEEGHPISSFDLRSSSVIALRPPRKSKSFGVIDKLRSTRFRNEGFSKEKWAEYRDAVKRTDGGGIVRRDNSSPRDYSTRNDLPKTQHAVHCQSSGRDNHVSKQKGKHLHSADAHQDRHKQYPILIAQNVLESPQGRNQYDTHGISGRMPESNEALHEVGCVNVVASTKSDQKIRSLSYRNAGICLASRTQSIHQEIDKDCIGMDGAKIRRGEVSVVGGSKVSLVRNDGQKNDGSGSGNNQSAAGVYLSDIISLKRSPDLESCSEHRSEDIVVPTSSMSLECSRDLVSFEQDGRESNLSDFERPEITAPQNAKFLQDSVSAPREFGRNCHDSKTETPERAKSEQVSNGTVLNTTATPYKKDSAIRLLTGHNMYTSSVKISLNPTKSETRAHAEGKRKPISSHVGKTGCYRQNAPTDTARECSDNQAKRHVANTLPQQHSFSFKDMSRETKNVREEETKGMRITQQPDEKSPDLPAHSTVDEGDFAGVVDGPTKNVKEIRAMFKGPDYADYAKPKSVAKKPAAGPVKLRNEKATQNENRNSAEVAQQVIELFKGALTLDENTTTPSVPTERQHEESTQNLAEVTEEPKISLKDKVASFDCGRSPVKDAEVNNNSANDEEISKTELKSSKHNEEPIKTVVNSEPAESEEDKKSVVTQEKVNAESYDESLDQFYGVLEELTAS